MMPEESQLGVRGAFSWALLGPKLEAWFLCPTSTRRFLEESATTVPWPRATQFHGFRMYFPTEPEVFCLLVPFFVLPVRWNRSTSPVNIGEGLPKTVLPSRVGCFESRHALPFHSIRFAPKVSGSHHTVGGGPPNNNQLPHRLVMADLVSATHDHRCFK